MPVEVQVEVVRALPTVAWYIFLVCLLWTIRGPVLRFLLPRLTSIEALGVKAGFQQAREDLAKAVNTEGTLISARERDRVLRRAARIQEIIAGAQILWVDDTPHENENIYRVLKRFDIDIDTVTSTEEAIRFLFEWKNEPDLIISDMKRGDDNAAGQSFLEEIRRRNVGIPTIFFIANFKQELGTPPYAFAITDRSDHLIHYIFDILERQRG